MWENGRQPKREENKEKQRNQFSQYDQASERFISKKKPKPTHIEGTCEAENYYFLNVVPDMLHIYKMWNCEQ